MKAVSSPSTPVPETVGAFQAKTELSRLLRQVRAGKAFIITQRGRPVAELKPVAGEPLTRKWGDMEGQIRMSDDFCAPLKEMSEHTPE